RARVLPPRRAPAAPAGPARADVRGHALRPLPGDPRGDRGPRLRRAERARVLVDRPPARAARAAHPPAPAAGAVTRRRRLVRGCGLAGIAAACEAAGRGAEVTLVERRPFLGGRAFSFTDPDTGRVVDNGQHVFMGCCPAYIDLL